MTLFQRRDLGRDGRLREMQRLGRLRHVLPLGDSHEDAELVECHDSRGTGRRWSAGALRSRRGRARYQFTEGFVWLGADGIIRPEAKGHVVFLFILYAQGVLPFLMPLAVLLMEPPGLRRKIVAGLAVLGAAECAYIFYCLITYPSHATVEHHSLAYRNVGTETLWIAAVYVVVTCGSLVASTHKVVRWFGILNFVGVAATLLMARWAFTSIWCLYAAIVSVVLLWQFWHATDRT